MRRPLVTSPFDELELDLKARRHARRREGGGRGLHAGQCTKLLQGSVNSLEEAA